MLKVMSLVAEYRGLPRKTQNKIGEGADMLRLTKNDNYS